jgi:hypothetical protein
MEEVMAAVMDMAVMDMAVMGTVADTGAAMAVIGTDMASGAGIGMGGTDIGVAAGGTGTEAVEAVIGTVSIQATALAIAAPSRGNSATDKGALNHR